MYLTDLNKQGSIGSNCFFAQIGPFNIVVDCGIHPKHMGENSLPNLKQIRDKKIDLIFITHCHLDHLGALPVLLRDHPDTPVICTPASQILAKRLMHNSFNVMERQKEEHGIGSLPLFNRSEIGRTIRSMIAMQPGIPRFLESDDGDRLSFTLYSAGHVPGAVGILLEHQHRKIFFTGDVLFESTTILQGAQFPTTDLDTIVLETTRGSTSRDPNSSRGSEMDRLLQTIDKALSRGGSVLIPVFALGRMQEMMAVLEKARKEKRIRQSPIYASGLGVDLANHFDQISRKFPTLDFNRKKIRQLPIVSLPERHRAGKSSASIYLLSSGMMVEHTPSYHAAASMLGDDKNVICFVGYCDPETPGGKLLPMEKGDTFLFGKLSKKVKINAKVEKFDLSSHSDREELLDFAIDRNPRKVVLSHGDPDSRQWFTQAIQAKDSKIEVVDPNPLQATLV